MSFLYFLPRFFFFAYLSKIGLQEAHENHQSLDLKNLLGIHDTAQLMEGGLWRLETHPDLLSVRAEDVARQNSTT